MRVLILMGSPRLSGNTAELCKPFLQALAAGGAETRCLPVAPLTIHPCRGCYACQNVPDVYGCVQKDDMDTVVENVLWADLIVLAAPIYSWYCPAGMKALLDRHYGLNKFYGSASGSLWAGKSVALLLTYGYEQDYATGPFVTGVQRLCAHSHLHYRGMYGVRDEDDLASFQTPEAVAGARAFAAALLKETEA